MLFLQGWGEPFCHPKIINMIHFAKKKGFLVGTTTNATLISEDIVKKLVELKLDVIALSLAGFQDSNDEVRKGTSYSQVLKVVEWFQREKLRARSSSPRVHIAYMWLKGMEKELLSALKDLSNLDVDLVVVSTLNFVPKADLRGYEVFFSVEVEELINEVKGLEKRFSEGIVFLIPDRNKTPRICTEDITRTAFVSSEAEVGPCVFSLIPVSSSVKYFFNSKEYQYIPLSFGNLKKNDFISIWNSKSYKRFRKDFVSFSLCKTCYKPYVRTLPETPLSFIP